MSRNNHRSHLQLPHRNRVTLSLPKGNCRTWFGRLTMTLVLPLVFTGCNLTTSSEPVDRLTFTGVLAQGVCAAVDELNADGQLLDEEAISAQLERSLRDAAVAEGISLASWSATRDMHFSPEDYDKLLKMNFSACLINLDEMPLYADS